MLNTWWRWGNEAACRDKVSTGVTYLVLASSVRCCHLLRTSDTSRFSLSISGCVWESGLPLSTTALSIWQFSPSLIIGSLHSANSALITYNKQQCVNFFLQQRHLDFACYYVWWTIIERTLLPTAFTFTYIHFVSAIISITLPSFNR